jgi:hypothetical protein
MPARNALAVNSPLSDAELATFSCSYSTAEGMLTRARVTCADTVLIPGASGGVGGALVQLAKLRGARVIALASEAKHGDVAALGADVVLPRAPMDLRAALRAKGSRCWPMSWVVRPGPGSSTFWNAAGATPVRAPSPGRWWSLDLRTLYLRDLTFTGSTVIDLEVMPNLVGTSSAVRSGPSSPPPIPWRSFAPRRRRSSPRPTPATSSWCPERADSAAAIRQTGAAAPLAVGQCHRACGAASARSRIDQAERGGGEVEADDRRQEHAARHRHREGRPEPATGQDQGQEPAHRRDRRRHDMAGAVHHHAASSPRRPRRRRSASS